jgi:hypothetical protein
MEVQPVILVSLSKSWPMVQHGEATAGSATLRAWPMWPRQYARLPEFADLILGVYQGDVVTAFDITRWREETEAERLREIGQGNPRHCPRVIFEGNPSPTWKHLIGSRNPGQPFTQWPVQYLDTAVLNRK